MSMMKRERPSTWPFTTWSPDVIDSAFRDMMHNFFGGERGLDRILDRGTPMMRIEEYVEEGSCVIRVELPGIDPAEDVDLRVVDGVLHLNVERQERSEDTRPDGYHSEFRYGTLSRSMRLPKGVDEHSVTATYKDGILEVRFPAPPDVLEPSSATKIPIERS